MFLKLHMRDSGRPRLINIDFIDCIDINEDMTTRIWIREDYFNVCEKFENIYKALNEYNDTEIIDVE